MAWLAVIGWFTLIPAPQQAAAIAALPWYCVVCGDSGIADVILNILLFLPLGVALHALGWPLRRAFAAVAALSIAIEVTQGLWLPGRDACLSDVLSDTTGGTLGWLSYRGLVALGSPGVSMARRGVVTLLLLMAGVWMITGAGLQPSLTDAPWIGQPSHAGRGPQPFPGILRRATIDGIDIPNEAMARNAPWRDSIVLELNATRNSTELFVKGIVMLRIVDTAHNVEIAIDQRGDDAWLRLRMRASDWRLHSPRWLVAHAMRMDSGIPWRFRWTWLHDQFTIVNEPIDGPHQPVVAIPLSTGLGWILIHPFINTIGNTRVVWTALWLIWWFGWLGWFAGWLGVSARLLIGMGATAMFIGASLLYGFPVLINELVFAAGGYVLLLAGARRRANKRSSSTPRPAGSAA